MSEFNYQHKKKFSEKEYIEIEKLGMEWSVKSILKKTILIFVGILLLFSKYTIGVGILLLFLFLFLSFMPLFSKSNTRKLFRETPYWQEELTFGVDQEMFWLTSESVEAKCKWKNLKVWQIKDGLLTLAANGIPKMYFPIAGLNENNVYEEVIILCKKFGIEYDNPKS